MRQWMKGNLCQEPVNITSFFFKTCSGIRMRGGGGSREAEIFPPSGEVRSPLPVPHVEVRVFES